MEAPIRMVTLAKRICKVGGADHVRSPLALVFADDSFAVDILDVKARLRPILISAVGTPIEEFLTPKMYTSFRFIWGDESALARCADTHPPKYRLPGRSASTTYSTSVDLIGTIYLD
jgi:hypothetical protein